MKAKKANRPWFICAAFRCFHEVGGEIVPRPTAAEIRAYDKAVSAADEMREPVVQAQQSIREADEERFYKDFPPERRDHIRKLLARADSALFEVECALEDITESAHEGDEKIRILNELDRAKVKAKVKKVERRRKTCRMVRSAKRHSKG